VDGWIVSGWSSTAARGSNLRHEFFLRINNYSFELYSSWFHRRNIFFIACTWLKESEFAGNEL
jgi:hypothetical protein